SVRTLPAEALRPGHRIAGLAYDDHRYRVETASGEAVRGDAVILATPAFATARIARLFDPRLADRCAAIPYASAATVSMAFERAAVAHPLNGSGFVVPRVEGTGILAGSWLSSKWPHRAPEGKVLLRTFLGGARDPHALELNDTEMVLRSLAALRPLLGLVGDPLFTRVYRWDNANAQHEVGHLARVAAIEQALEPHAGLFVTGSGYRGVGIPDCVADARSTARRAAAWLNGRR
ncbi:MAG: protoporphyrinogen oxidase, partial [Vicinamibacterales bacterium]